MASNSEIRDEPDETGPQPPAEPEGDTDKGRLETLKKEIDQTPDLTAVPFVHDVEDIITEELKRDLRLHELADYLRVCSDCRHLIVYATADEALLQTKAQNELFDVLKLCDSVSQIIQSFQIGANNIVEKMHIAYLYLLDGFADFAITDVEAIGKDIKGMKKAWEKSQEKISKRDNGVGEIIEGHTAALEEELPRGFEKNMLHFAAGLGCGGRANKLPQSMQDEATMLTSLEFVREIERKVPKADIERFVIETVSKDASYHRTRDVFEGDHGGSEEARTMEHPVDIDGKVGGPLGYEIVETQKGVDPGGDPESMTAEEGLACMETEAHNGVGVEAQRSTKCRKAEEGEDQGEAAMSPGKASAELPIKAKRQAIAAEPLDYIKREADALSIKTEDAAYLESTVEWTDAIVNGLERVQVSETSLLLVPEVKGGMSLKIVEECVDRIRKTFSIDPNPNTSGWMSDLYTYVCKAASAVQNLWYQTDVADAIQNQEGTTSLNADAVETNYADHKEKIEKYLRAKLVMEVVKSVTVKLQGIEEILRSGTQLTEQWYKECTQLIQPLMRGNAQRSKEMTERERRRFWDSLEFKKKAWKYLLRWRALQCYCDQQRVGIRTIRRNVEQNYVDNPYPWDAIRDCWRLADGLLVAEDAPNISEVVNQYKAICNARDGQDNGRQDKME